MIEGVVVTGCLAEQADLFRREEPSFEDISVAVAVREFLRRKGTLHRKLSYLGMVLEESGKLELDGGQGGIERC